MLILLYWFYSDDFMKINDRMMLLYVIDGFCIEIVSTFDSVINNSEALIASSRMLVEVPAKFLLIK